MVHVRVEWLEYKRDTAYYERVLDIADGDNIASQVLPDRSVKVTQLSFNEHHGYLCHRSALEEVVLEDSQPMQTYGSFVKDFCLPKNALAFSGQIALTKGLTYAKKAFKELKSCLQ